MKSLEGYVIYLVAIFILFSSCIYSQAEEPIAIKYNTPVVSQIEDQQVVPNVSQSKSKVGSIGLYIYLFTSNLASGPTVHAIDAIEELFEDPAGYADDLQMVKKNLQQAAIDNMTWGTTFSLLLALFPLAFCLEKLAKYLLSRYLPSRNFDNDDVPVLPSIPNIINNLVVESSRLLVFSLVAIFLFTIVYGDNSTILIRAIFYSALALIIFGRAIGGISTIYLNSAINLRDCEKRDLHRGFMLIVWVNCLTLFFGVCLKHLGVSSHSVQFFIIVSSTIKVVVIALVLAWYYKTITSLLKNFLHCQKAPDGSMCQLACFWLIPAIIYLITIWGLQVNSIYYQSYIAKGAYFSSLLAVPLYFVLVRMSCWIARTVVKSMHLKISVEDELSSRVCRYVYPVMLFGVAIWVMKKWGYELPFISDRADAVLNITITLALTLLAWHLITGLIEKKLKRVQPEEKKEEDEWGADCAQGREYTLLPILRKCIGSTLALVAVLICLSALGVNIAPILAGAGVLGIALGFGSQKVVSDILSGFFFLIDDAFRVGEYIETATVKGRVEEITLRNLLLRHHRGMLQIVPFTELGAVTNFMRGGIVEKFNLEFPYDADVDKIRKIIKKVGLAMLEEEEYKQDFIRPIKSQGVREITNSIMIIRIKFTAKPGRHFVIRREAYRRVSEALNAKGIQYAHKKVIVEIPEDVEGKKILERSAAAALKLEEDQQLASTTTI